MNSTSAKSAYKYCIVPACLNTTRTAPNKIFLNVPRNSDLRRKWCKVMRRTLPYYEPLSAKTGHHCCEDHFNLPTDMANYMQYRVMGSVSQIRMNPGCVPTKFECQQGKKTGTSGTIVKFDKRRRKKILGPVTCEKQLENSSTVRKHFYFEETAPGRSDSDTESADSDWEMAAMRVEPCEDRPDRVFTHDIRVESIKTEEEAYSQLYPEHIIKKEMVIGPTEISLPAQGLVDQHREYARAALEAIGISSDYECSRLLSCRVQLQDVANEFWCRGCKQRIPSVRVVKLFCPTGSTTSHKLSCHTSASQLSDKPLTCQCKKQFSRWSNLTQHLRTHVESTAKSKKYCEEILETKSEAIIEPYKIKSDLNLNEM